MAQLLLRGIELGEVEALFRVVPGPHLL